MSTDVFQQIFILSLLANMPSIKIGTQAIIQSWFRRVVNVTLPHIGSGWEVVWGPVVWKKAPKIFFTGPDLAWYIAYNRSLQFEDGSVRPAYVIAITGTSPGSVHAWLKSDLAVHTVCDFNAWVAGGIRNRPVPATDVSKGKPYIATGTVDAVHLILTTPAPKSAASAGMTLLDFITSINQSDPPTIITTGISLGGALSPSLALSLVLAGVTPANRTLTYPVAGPSPGNIEFADLFMQTLPARKLTGAKVYEGWNLNLVNKLDIVPQAWRPNNDISPEQNLGNIPSLCGCLERPLVRKATKIAIAHSLKSGVLYKPLPSQYFSSSPRRRLKKDMLGTVAVPLRHTVSYLAEVGVVIPKIN